MRTIAQRFSSPLTDVLRPHHTVTTFLTVFIIIFTSNFITLSEKEFWGADIHHFPNTLPTYVRGRGSRRVVGRGLPQDIDMEETLWVRL